MSLTVTGITEAVDFGNNFANNMAARYTRYLQTAANEAIDLARSNLQNNRNVNTGTLLASIKIISIEQNGLRVIIGSEEEYAKYIEYGRGPVVAVDHKHPLSWIDKTSGKRIFSMRSKETHPMPFFEPAVLVIEKRYPEIVVTGENEYLGSAR